MESITLGNQNLFLKGTAEVVITDIATGNIIGYDNVATESAVITSVNMGEIAGGLGNALAAQIPDTTRVTGSTTSQAFSLQQRALITGGTISYNAPAPVCETIVASGATLTVSQVPVRALEQSQSDTYAYCYVKPSASDTYQGTNYGIDMTTREVQTFVATAGTSYDVFYFTSVASAQMLNLPDNFVPTIASIRIKHPVYAMQNNSVANGSFVGNLYVVVPRAQFTGDAGHSGSQTSNATTFYNWTALSNKTTMMSCTNCTASAGNYAYYIFVPCGDPIQDVEALIVVGGGVSTSLGLTAQIPVKYYMPNGETVQPVYTDLIYSFNRTAATQGTPVSLVFDGNVIGTLSADGIITTDDTYGGVVTVEISLTKANGTTLKTYATVEITA